MKKSMWRKKKGVMKKTSARRKMQVMNCTWSIWYVTKKKGMKVTRRMKKVAMLVSLMKAHQLKQNRCGISN
eukprot:2074525-Ditylum_brightwellii.AAC.1